MILLKKVNWPLNPGSATPDWSIGRYPFNRGMMYKKRKNRPVAGDYDHYSIGDVSRIVDLSQKTIRDYEKMGLIKPKREANTNNRIYSDFEIEQIRQITRLIHEEGFTLQCLQHLLRLAPCWNIFDCPVKEQCPAYKNAPIPCYETRQRQGTLCSGKCEQCAVYINRTGQIRKVLDRPGTVPEQNPII